MVTLPQVGELLHGFLSHGWLHESRA